MCVTYIFRVCHSTNLSFVSSVGSRIDINICFVGSHTAKNVEDPLSYDYNMHSWMLHTCSRHVTHLIFHFSVLSVRVLTYMSVLSVPVLQKILKINFFMFTTCTPVCYPYVSCMSLTKSFICRFCRFSY